MSELPATVDVAIIGGGFAGMATAWWLNRRGVRDVLVCEREPELGRYASGRSAGMGRQLAEDDLVTGLTVTGAAHLRQLFPKAWTPTGGILSFDDPAHARAYEQRAARMGVEARPIDRAAVLAHWPQLEHVDIAGALWVPTDGLIDVHGLLAALAEAGRVARATAVERIAPAERGAMLWTSRGTLTARVVVDAAGAWAGRLTGDPLLDSLKRHVYVLEGVAAATAPFVWHLGKSELYVRAFDGQIMTSPCDGTPTNPGDQQPDPAGEALMRSRHAGSPLQAAPITRSWACQRTFPRQPGMKLERDRERPWLVWAAGLGGHGATAAVAVGETVAGLVLEALG